MKEEAMADFYQTGVVTTLHRLHNNGFERLERELGSFSESSFMGWSSPPFTRNLKSRRCEGSLPIWKARGTAIFAASIRRQVKQTSRDG
jgi:hypothetical protein